MFKQLTLTTLLFASLLLFGCGKDGSPGDASLALDWDWYVDGYNDNNPSLPDVITRNFYYSSGTGTYQSEYICSDGSGSVWYWEYEYTISINQGEKGKLFRRGADGKDRSHKLFLHGLSGGSLSVSENSVSKPKKKGLKPYTLNTDDYKKVYHGDPIIEQYSENGYTTVVKKRMFTLE